MQTDDMEYVLSRIFSYLLPKELSKCRLVCTTWQIMIETRLSEIWCELCQTDFPDIWDSAYKKSNGCRWYDLYRSLTLWSKLPQARETITQVHTSLYGRGKVKSFQIIYSGLIAIQLKANIIYYDIDIREPIYERLYVNSNDIYRENMHIISWLSGNAQLNIMIKMPGNFEGALYVIYEVTQYLLIDKKIYCITSDNSLHIYKQIEGVFSRKTVTHISNGVLSLGKRDGYLYILTHNLTIQMLDGYELRNVKVSKSILKYLRKYNFQDQLDWNTLYHWWIFRKKIPPAVSLFEIVTFRVYGHMLFVGYHWGVLHIYNSSNSDDLQEIVMRKPLKVYNFMERGPLSMCPVLQIDVIEDQDGHNLLVALPKKFVVINFSHALNK